MPIEDNLNRLSITGNNQQDPPAGGSQDPPRPTGPQVYPAGPPAATYNAASSTNVLPSHIFQNDSQKIEFKLHTLGKDNYTIWKQHTKNVLEAKNLLSAVEHPTILDQGKERLARALLTSALDSDNQMKVINCNSAHAIWKRLESVYENKTTFEAQNLHNKLHSFKIQNLSQVAKSLGEIENIAHKLRLLGENVSDNAVMSAMLRALPSSFRTFITVWKGTATNERTVDNLISRIMAEVEDNAPKQESALLSQHKVKGRGNNSRNKGQGSSNFNKKNRRGTSKARQGKSTFTCHYCKEPGHIIRDCAKLKARKAREGKEAQDQKKSGDSPDKGETRAKKTSPRESELHYELMAIRDQDMDLSETDWVTDSGASAHMTSNRHWLVDYVPYQEPVGIIIGDGNTIEGIGCGKIITPNCTITDVMYVPKMTFNLFSVGRVTDKGFSVVYERDDILIIKDDKVLMRGRRRDGIYAVNLDIKIEREAMDTALVTVDEWHDRFGHVSKDMIRKMADSGIVNGLRISDSKEPECPVCVLGKCTNASHPCRSTPKTDVPGAVLHFDTVGPIRPESLGGNRYFILGKDEASSFRLVRFAAQKSDIPVLVKAMIGEAELKTKNRVLAICSDNGSEFKNQELADYTASLGINHIFSAPYTPQQNGLIEREIRSVMDSARTMLLKANLTRALWPEAVQTAIYVLNRVPTRRKPHQTPFEQWHGKIPDVKNLRVFGQRAFVRKPDVKIVGKWDTRAEEALFVGYTEYSNTYRFFKPEDESIIVSCNVKFPEILDYEEKQPLLEESDSDDDTVIVEMDIDDHSAPSDQKEQSDRTDQKQSGQDSSSSNPGQSTSNEVLAIMPLVPKKEEPSEPVPSFSGMQMQESRIGKIRRERRPKQESGLQKALRIPKNLLIRNKPPQILDHRLRSRSRRHVANISTIEADYDPGSYTEAMRRPDRDHWIAAMEEEIESLRKNNVWKLVDRPAGNVVSNRWVLRIKRKPDGTVDRYRARLVARGFSQIYGIDYNETYAPVVNTTVLRLLFGFAASERLEMAQFDVKTAFLYGSLTETVYMEQPEGFVQDSSKVCLLQRSLYGLKQSPRQWNRKFTDFLTSVNLEELEEEHCVFYRKDPLLIIALYVDDGIIFARSKKDIDVILQKLEQQFEIHVTDGSTFLGFQIKKDDYGGIFLYQEAYIHKMLEKFDMTEANSVDNPSASTRSNRDDSEDFLDKGLYRRAVGSLLYASTMTRIDIAYAVNVVSRYMSDPKVDDWTAVKRILRYLQGTPQHGLYFSGGCTKELEAYCDANFVDPDSGKSTSGYLVTYGGTPISWKSQKQSMVVISACEAELVSLCSATAEVMWLRKVGRRLDCIPKDPVPILSDNEGAIAIVHDEKSARSQRTRHITVKPSYVREKIKDNLVTVRHLSTEEQPADMLTKPIPNGKFRWTRAILMTLLTLQFFSSCESILFTKVSPIVWTDTKKYVDEGIETYMLQIHFINPCSVLNRVPVHSGTGELVPNPMTSLGSMNQGSYQPPVQQVPVNNHIPGVVYPKADHAASPAPPHTQPAQAQPALNYPSYDHMHNVQMCNEYYAREIEGPLSDIRRVPQATSRSPRGIVDFIAGMFMTNILETIKQKIWPRASESEVGVQAAIIEKEIHKLNDEVNITSQILTATNDGLKTITDMLKHTNERITVTSHENQELAVLTSYIVAKIVIYGSNLRRMKNTLRHRKFDLELLMELISDKDLDDLEESSMVLKKYSSPAPGVLRIEFSARRRAPDTQVYRVDAFRYWSNLSYTPALLEYSGERYLIYNSSSNCAMAVTEPTQDFVTASCTEPGYGDNRLAQWSKVYTADNPENEIANTSIKEAWPYIYIYCYRLHITIRSETSKCPTYVFALNASIPWNTTDRVYKPNIRSIELSESFYRVEPEVHSVHFKHYTSDLDDVTAIERVHNLTLELTKLRQEHTAFNLPVAGKFTFANATWSLLWIIFLTILAYIFYAIFTSGRRHRKVMRTVTDGIYGDGYYETVRRSRHTSGSRGRETTESRAVGLHMTINQTPSSGPPLPAQNVGSLQVAQQSLPATAAARAN